MSLATDIAAMHQQVRDLVEREYPDVRVTSIEGSTRTEYREDASHRTLPPTLLLERVGVLFAVETMPVINTYPSLRCVVRLDSDGSLRITEATPRLGVINS